MILLLALLAFAVSLVVPAPLADDLVISLPNGKVQGAAYVTDNNKTYYGFRGIPYGTPPVGNLRFEAPRPAESWDDVFDATKDGFTCLSAMNNQEIENEDCLNINVYTPSLKPLEKLPVMFWIYGGKFINGNSLKGHYGPDFLMEEDVVFVSFNYRIGPFGFLSTGDTAITGNFGLKDQVLAMKWVQDNIEYFGGDRDKVTIFGQSAGGASTGLQLVSKKSAGLYRAAIVESGSALVQWAIDENPLPYATSLAEVLSGGQRFDNTHAMKEFLQGKTAQEIIEAANSLVSVAGNKISQNYEPTIQAWPVVEAENDDAFLTESPYEILDSGRFNQVPTVIGICTNEALMLLESIEHALIMAQGYDTVPSSILPTDLRPNSSDLDVVIKKIQNMYLKEGEYWTTNLVTLSSYSTDNMFVRGAIKTAELQVKYSPVYLYQFAYFGRARYPFLVEGAEKAAHGAELPFIFKMEGVNLNYTNPTDILTQDRTVKLWTNFAKYLNPTPEESELLDNIIWPVVSPTDFKFLNINGTLEVRSHLRENYQEWSGIYETYGKKPFITY